MSDLPADKHHPDCDFRNSTAAKEAAETFGVDVEENSEVFACNLNCAYREVQLKGFVLGDEDLEHFEVNPDDVPDEVFEHVAESVTEYLQSSFQDAVHNALVEAGLVS